jgi:hypothetical protein
MNSVTLYNTRDLQGGDIKEGVTVMTFYDKGLLTTVLREHARNDMIGEIPASFKTSQTTFDWRPASAFATESMVEGRSTVEVSMWELVKGKINGFSEGLYTVPNAQLTALPQSTDEFSFDWGPTAEWAWWLQVGSQPNFRELRDVSDHTGDRDMQERMLAQQAQLGWFLAASERQNLAFEWAVAKAIHPYFAGLDGNPDPMTVEGFETSRLALDSIPMSPWLTECLQHFLPAAVTVGGMGVTELRLPAFLATGEALNGYVSSKYKGITTQNIFLKLVPTYQKWVRRLLANVPAYGVPPKRWRTAFPSGAPTTSIGGKASPSLRNKMYDQKNFVETDGYSASVRISQADILYVDFISDIPATLDRRGRAPLGEDGGDSPTITFIQPSNARFEIRALSIKSGYAITTTLPTNRRTPYVRHVYDKEAWDMRYALPPHAYGISLAQGDRYFVSAVAVARQNGIQVQTGRINAQSFVLLDTRGVPVAPSLNMRRLLAVSTDGLLSDPQLADRTVMDEATKAVLDVTTVARVWELHFVFTNEPDVFYSQMPALLPTLPVY